MYELRWLAVLPWAFVSAAATASDFGQGWSGSIGVLGGFSNGSVISEGVSTTVKPVLGLRKGRFSLTLGAGFAALDNTDTGSSMGLDLLRRDDLRLSLSLRSDRGRNDLRSIYGLDAPGATLRFRPAVTWIPHRHWRVAAGVNFDALGRNGGTTADITLGHVRALSPTLRWLPSLRLGFGDDQFVTRQFGLDATAARSSGLPTFTAQPGLVSVRLASDWRLELGNRWVATWGLSAVQFAGAARATPLTDRALSFGAQAGVARRF